MTIRVKKNPDTGGTNRRLHQFSRTFLHVRAGRSVVGEENGGKKGPTSVIESSSRGKWSPRARKGR